MDEGAERGPEAIRAIDDAQHLAAYPSYAAALGEFEFRRGNYARAHGHFHAARALARSLTERRYYERCAAACEADAPRVARACVTYPFSTPSISPLKNSFWAKVKATMPGVTTMT